MWPSGAPACHGMPAGVGKPVAVDGQSGTGKTNLPDSMICLDWKPRPYGGAGRYALRSAILLGTKPRRVS